MAAGKEIKRLRESQSKKVSADYAASLIGVDVERLRKWEYRDADPYDTADKIKVEKYFGCPINKLETLENFQFYTPNNDRAAAELEDEKGNSSVFEPAKPYGDSEKDPIMQALLKLLDNTREQTEINAKHANAADNNALARLKEAENNQELIGIISLNARQGTHIAAAAIESKVLELLSVLHSGKGKQFATREAALATMNRLLSEIENRNEEIYTASATGK